MSLEFYKLVHILGLVLLAGSLVAFAIGATTKTLVAKQIRIGAFAAHGVGLILQLITGFGMLAKLGLFADLPNWAKLKILIWAILGVFVSFFRRKPALAPISLLIVFALIGAAGYLALFKPF